MSKVIEVSSMGFKMNFTVPSTPEEYNTLAKRENAVVDDAVMNIFYRSTLPQFRPLFAEKLENETGIVRSTEPVLAADGTQKKDSEGNLVSQYTESEVKYADRVAALLVEQKKFESPEAALASFAPLAQAVLDTIAFDPSATEKAPSGPKTISKAYVEFATKCETDGTLAERATKLATKLGNWKVEPTVDSFSRAIHEDQRRIKAELAKSALAAY